MRRRKGGRKASAGSSVTGQVYIPPRHSNQLDTKYPKNLANPFCRLYTSPWPLKKYFSLKWVGLPVNVPRGTVSFDVCGTEQIYYLNSINAPNYTTPTGAAAVVEGLESFAAIYSKYLVTDVTIQVDVWYGNPTPVTTLRTVLTIDTDGDGTSLTGVSLNNVQNMSAMAVMEPDFRSANGKSSIGPVKIDLARRIGISRAAYQAQYDNFGSGFGSNPSTGILLRTAVADNAASATAGSMYQQVTIMFHGFAFSRDMQVL